MARVYIGTSGYSYKDWLGPVYPEGTQPRDYLALYSREFNLVELNFSYYRQPEAGMLEKMLARTGPDFLFCIKAHKSLTHQPDPDLEKNIATFLAGISPLQEAGRLGAVLFQFPYSFHYTPANRKYLDSLLRAFTGIPRVVEFRSREWQRESVFRGLGARNAGYVNVDVPPLANLPLPTAEVTADPAYLRFHGRNREQWWSGDNTTRYDYLYQQAEMEEWVSRVMKMVETAKILLVTFNNHYNGQAVFNGRQFKQMLEDRGITTD